MRVFYRHGDSFDHQIGEIETSNVEDIFFSLDESLDDTKDLLRIFGAESPSLESGYLKIQKSLNLSHHETFRSLPTEKRSSMCRSTIRLLEENLQNESNQVYLRSFLKQKNFLRRLARPVISASKAKKLSDSMEHKNTALRVLDFARSQKKTVYSMSRTVTGRLTVTNGPNILTLPSEARTCIMSQYEGGKILQLDLTAAEPFLALLTAGKTPPPDIYDHIAREVLDSEVTRSVAKLVTLSALYGQSSFNLSKQLPESINARSVISKTKSYFNSESLFAKLKSDFKGGVFRNVLGRPIFVEDNRTDLLISYYLQSSIAECSILLFSDFYEKFSGSMIPYYVIHDALIFDASPEFARRLLEKESLKLRLGTWKFRSKVTEV